MSDAFMFYTFVALWSFFISWWLTFNIFPKWFAKKVHTTAHETIQAVPKVVENPRARHSTYDGFRAYATGGELTVEDIVKALSRPDTRP